jgi:nucleoside-diphosphate-sugar epimerase
MSNSELFTVLGAGGFIGGAMVEYLRAAGHVCLAPKRSESLIDRDLGNVIYCIGLTADWRRRPLDVIEAHAGKVAEVLRQGRFTSLLYLSSTRVYKRAQTAVEDVVLSAQPSDPDDQFELSKMLGETICLADPRLVRVVRLSNIYGADFGSENFLASIITDALRGRVVLRTALDSEKDYLGVDQTVELLARIALTGRHRIYNVASGRNISHRAIVERLMERTSCALEIMPNAPRTTFPEISIRRIVDEFDFHPRTVTDDIDILVDTFRVHHAKRNATT